MTRYEAARVPDRTVTADATPHSAAHVAVPYYTCMTARGSLMSAGLLARVHTGMKKGA